MRVHVVIGCHRVGVVVTELLDTHVTTLHPSVPSRYLLLLLQAEMAAQAHSRACGALAPGSSLLGKTSGKSFRCQLCAPCCHWGRV